LLNKLGLARKGARFKSSALIHRCLSFNCGPPLRASRTQEGPTRLPFPQGSPLSARSGWQPEHSQDNIVKNLNSENGAKKFVTEERNGCLITSEASGGDRRQEQ
jgi:hypothetical protein